MELTILVFLMMKHVVADYVLQFPWMWRDKAYYGKRGGLAHAGFHGLLTFFVLLPSSVPIFYSFLLGLLDSVAHYHIDYIKSRWIQKNNPSINSQKYWTVHGIDQFLHFLTYAVLIALIR